MTMEFETPMNAATDQGLKMVVYGPAGSGKTLLCTTADGPTLIINSEGGLLSIKDTKADVKIHTVHNMKDVAGVYEHLLKKKDFAWVCLDSITEVAEVCLAAEKNIASDPRQAYGELIDKMTSLIKAFRDLPGVNVVFTAKQERVQDDGGRLMYGPGMPGAKLGPAMPYYFDLVCALRVEKDNEGNISHWLQARRDGQYEAKDRSGRLEQFTEPNLAEIAKTILASPQKKAA
jgi:hypothetical protein